MNNSILADLYDRAVGVIPPTPLRFFTPNAKFWAALENYRTDVIVEFGTGRGDTLREARARGFRAAGCDVSASIESIMDGIHQMSALRFPLAPGMVAIACRPDHSGWVQAALERALSHECVAIYVGKPENVERDLDDDFAELGWLIEDVGEEGELMLLFRP